MSYSPSRRPSMLPTQGQLEVAMSLDEGRLATTGVLVTVIHPVVVEEDLLAKCYHDVSLSDAWLRLNDDGADTL